MRSPSVTSAGGQNVPLASADRQRFSGLPPGAPIPHDVPPDQRRPRHSLLSRYRPGAIPSTFDDVEDTGPVPTPFTQACDVIPCVDSRADRRGGAKPGDGLDRAKPRRCRQEPLRVAGWTVNYRRCPFLGRMARSAIRGHTRALLVIRPKGAPSPGRNSLQSHRVARGIFSRRSWRRLTGRRGATLACVRDWPQQRDQTGGDHEGFLAIPDAERRCRYSACAGRWRSGPTPDHRQRRKGFV